MWIIKETNNGSRLRSMLKPEKSSDVISESVHGHQPDNSGIHYQGYISSALSVYTDMWEAYEKVVPSKRHFAQGLETGLTNYIERLNNTLRQRISRLVRKTLSFSKKLENHIGAIWNFIHEYNQQVRKKMGIA